MTLNKRRLAPSARIIEGRQSSFYSIRCYSEYRPVTAAAELGRPVQHTVARENQPADWMAPIRISPEPEKRFSRKCEQRFKATVRRDSKSLSSG
jgi:hypothetical protein